MHKAKRSQGLTKHILKKTLLSFLSKLMFVLQLYGSIGLFAWLTNSLKMEMPISMILSLVGGVILCFTILLVYYIINNNKHRKDTLIIDGNQKQGMTVPIIKPTNNNNLVRIHAFIWLKKLFIVTFFYSCLVTFFIFLTVSQSSIIWDNSFIENDDDWLREVDYDWFSKDTLPNACQLIWPQSNISSDNGHNLIIDQSGVLWYWDSNNLRFLSDGTVKYTDTYADHRFLSSNVLLVANPMRMPRNVASIHTNGDYSVVVTHDGAVWVIQYGFGRTAASVSQCMPLYYHISNVKNVRYAMIAGDYEKRVYAILYDGTLISWLVSSMEYSPSEYVEVDRYWGSEMFLKIVDGFGLLQDGALVSLNYPLKIIYEGREENQKAIDLWSVDGETLIFKTKDGYFHFYSPSEVQSIANASNFRSLSMNSDRFVNNSGWVMDVNGIRHYPEIEDAIYIDGDLIITSTGRCYQICRIYDDKTNNRLEPSKDWVKEVLIPKIEMRSILMNSELGISANGVIDFGEILPARGQHWRNGNP